VEAQGVEPQARERTTWEVIAEELQALRRRAGSPSYAMIAQLVADRRVAQGMTPAAARVAKSTVHGYFTPGRTRGSLPLVRELVEALGSDPAQVDEWLRNLHTPQALPAGSGTDDGAPAQSDTEEVDAAQAAVGVWQACILLAACVALNMVGRVLVDFLHLPIYLDMAGTAIAAMALGPWRGAAVGTATNVLGVASSGLVSLAFIPVNVLGALVWGYGLRSFGMGRTLHRFFVLNALTGLACTAIAVPILHFGYDGLNGNGTDVITTTVRALTGVDVLGVLVANTLTSLADKILSGFVALVAIASLPLWWRRRVPLVLPTDLAPAPEHTASDD
jgi:energy-coupling factor transport system substrate-specific component